MVKKKVVAKKKADVNKLVFKKSYLFVGLILFLVLLLLIFSSKKEVVNSVDYEFYNGYEFSRHPQLENVWITNVMLGDVVQRFEFRYHPVDLEVFSYDSDANQYFFLTQLVDGQVYLSFSEEVLAKQSGYISLAGYELARILRGVHGVTVIVSAENLEEYSWVTCDDASVDDLVVEFRQGSPRIEASDFCISLYFDDVEDSLRMSSLLIYKLLGIMD
ncbi:hypothetical protein KO361_02645 [Candidatus Woesearchaeota archaeon]|nr:hypothetical protein [Candidatus Woesearchaeota archaeon]